MAEPKPTAGGENPRESDEAALELRTCRRFGASVEPQHEAELVAFVGGRAREARHEARRQRARTGCRPARPEPLFVGPRTVAHQEHGLPVHWM